LKTYPRTLKCIGRQRHKNNIQDVETIHFELHCKLWGHFTKGGIFQRRRSWRGKMTHGSLVRVQDNKAFVQPLPGDSIRRKKRLYHKRLILASFSAKRPKKQPHNNLPAEDFAYFGY
jgi:hypothetical protein